MHSAGPQGGLGVELAQRVKHLRKRHDGAVIETAHPMGALDGACVGGPGREDRAPLGVRKFGMVENFTGMAERQAWRHQPINRQGASALGPDMVWCIVVLPSAAVARQGEDATGPICWRPRHGHIPLGDAVMIAAGPSRRPARGKIWDRLA